MQQKRLLDFPNQRWNSVKLQLQLLALPEDKQKISAFIPMHRKIIPADGEPARQSENVGEPGGGEQSRPTMK